MWDKICVVSLRLLQGVSMSDYWMKAGAVFGVPPVSVLNPTASICYGSAILKSSAQKGWHPWITPLQTTPAR